MMFIIGFLIGVVFGLFTPHISSIVDNIAARVRARAAEKDEFGY